MNGARKAMANIIAQIARSRFIRSSIRWGEVSLIPIASTGKYECHGEIRPKRQSFQIYGFEEGSHIRAVNLGRAAEIRRHRTDEAWRPHLLATRTRFIAWRMPERLDVLHWAPPIAGQVATPALRNVDAAAGHVAATRQPHSPPFAPHERAANAARKPDQNLRPPPPPCRTTASRKRICVGGAWLSVRPI